LKLNLNVEIYFYAISISILGKNTLKSLLRKIQAFPTQQKVKSINQLL